MEKIIRKVFRIYKLVVSPYIPGQCRFYPTCSDYALEAMVTYGFFKGGFMTVSRLIRCRPGVDGGYDPVLSKKQPIL